MGRSSLSSFLITKPTSRLGVGTALGLVKCREHADSCPRIGVQTSAPSISRSSSTRRYLFLPSYQIDLHPFMRHPEIVKICEDNGILLEVSATWFARLS